MQYFQNALFVIDENNISELALEKALLLVKENKAELSFMVLHHDFPMGLKAAEDAYKQSIEHKLYALLKKFDGPQPVEIFYETKSPHFVQIIRAVLKNNYDLVIKLAESRSAKETRGFKSLDMSLLRKCPCPVWLCRSPYEDGVINILTAVDPFTEDATGQDLNLKLLTLGQNLSNILNATNYIVSCWEFEHEDFLRHSPFAKMQNDAVDNLLQEADKKHEDALLNLVALSKASINTDNIFRERGGADVIIPNFIEDKKIDIVLMGTVARTGIPGFFIGNTAENLLQEIPCGMFAIKPNGFVSPIKAY